MTSEQALPSDLSQLLSPGIKHTEAPWYLEKKHEIEAQAEHAVKKIQAAQQRQCKESQAQGRFLFALAGVVLVVVLMVGVYIWVISALTVLPLLGLGLFYNAYSGMIIQANTQKMARVMLQRDKAIERIKPNLEDVIKAFRTYEQKRKLSGKTFSLHDNGLLNIGTLGLTYVPEDVKKLYVVEMPLLMMAKNEQYTTGGMLVQGELSNYWGLDTNRVRQGGDEALSEVVSTISFKAIGDSGTYWCVFQNEESSNEAFALLSEFRDDV